MLRALALALLLPLAPEAVAQFRSDAPVTGRSLEPGTRTLARGAEKSGAASELTATYTGTPQWLEGVSVFSGSAFAGGVYYGHNAFTGSSITPLGDVPVEIVFDASMATLARVWRRDLGYQDGGVGTFRGAAYDVSDPANPRRLNVGFAEDSRYCAPVDAVWGPGVDEVGCREYLFILNSDYDGTGETYANRSVYDQNNDFLYFLGLRVPSGRSLYESTARINLTFPPVRFMSALVPSNGLAEMSVTYTPDASLPDGATVGFTYAADGGSPEDVGTTVPAGDTPTEVIGSIDGLDTETFYTFTAVVNDASGTVLVESQSVRLKPAVSLNAAVAGRWAERGSWADIWGYTAPDGTEYALIALQSFGLSIVDITGDTPTEVGFVPTASGANDSKDVKVIGSMAYLVNETGPIQVIDLSTPEAPVQVGTFAVQTGVNNAGAHNLTVDDRYLYVTGGRQDGNAGVRIYDTQPNPASPQLIGEFRPTHFSSPYYHDFYVIDNVGYGPNIYGGGVDILDLSDRSNPQLVSTFGYPGSGAHNVCGTADGKYVYVGDEIGSAGNWTRIFDVEDSMDAEFIGDIIVDPNAVVHNCYVVDGLLHIGHYTEGYRVFDVRTTPEAPVEVAFYDTYQGPSGGYNGVWSIFPYFPSGRVAVSDRNNGLFVIELDASVLTTTEPPVVPGELTIVAGPNPASGVMSIRTALASPTTVRLSVTDALGREVAVLHEGEATGTLRATLNTGTLSPGVYVIRMDAFGETATRTITVVR